MFRQSACNNPWIRRVFFSMKMLHTTLIAHEMKVSEQERLNLLPSWLSEGCALGSTFLVGFLGLVADVVVLAASGEGNRVDSGCFHPALVS
jgi:hypothetical protein